MNERNITIVVDLLKQGFTSEQVINEFEFAGIKLTEEDKEEIRSIARGNGLK